MAESDQTAWTGADCPAAQDRRGFLAQAVAIAGGAIGLLVPTLSGLVAFLNPLRQKSQGGDFVRVTSLEVLPEDGTPRKFSIIADRVDAWNRFPKEPIGAVYVWRTGENQVAALNVVCPHAGCSIQFEAASGGKFFCPCHAASFDLAGKRTDATSPSPRDLDSLQAKVEGTEVWVKFQNFRIGTSTKEARA